MARCKWCMNQMKWAKTENGKSIPLDPDPAPGGNIELINGIARVVGQSDDPADVRHYSHFATCESPFNPANQKRKKR